MIWTSLPRPLRLSHAQLITGLDCHLRRPLAQSLPVGFVKRTRHLCRCTARLAARSAARITAPLTSPRSRSIVLAANSPGSHLACSPACSPRRHSRSPVRRVHGFISLEPLTLTLAAPLAGQGDRPRFTVRVCARLHRIARGAGLHRAGLGDGAGLRRDGL